MSRSASPSLERGVESLLPLRSGLGVWGLQGFRATLDMFYQLAELEASRGSLWLLGFRVWRLGPRVW